MGVRLSIDDFGTGYTSMAYLKKLPVDEVKIDKSFVMNMLKDANDAVIVRSIIDLAHNMNYTVVAEGVESRKILDALSGLACDVAQGYYFSRPVPVAEFESWYRSAVARFTPATEIKKRGKGVRAIYP
jgi:EAL domain-containing protein (putative c-di-GMP-specific phosphodiesterase class I)